MLLERIKQDFGLSYAVVDTKNMDRQEIRNIYAFCAHKATTCRLYGRESGFSVRDSFTSYGGDSGDKFGSKTPALIVYSEGEIDFVLPHYASIRKPLSKWHGATVTINAFLSALENALKTDLEETLAHLRKAEADFDSYKKSQG